MKEIFPQATVDEKVRFGKPVIAGTRVPVEVIVGHVVTGDAIEKIMREHRLNKKQIFTALKYKAFGKQL